MAGKSFASKILESIVTGSVVLSNGRHITLAVGTKLPNFNRIDHPYVAQQGEKMKAAVSKNEDVIPPGTQKVVLQDTAHESDSDRRTHITAIAVTEDGQEITIHLKTD